MEFQIYPKDDLSDEQEGDERSKTRMNVVSELSTFMSVTEKPTDDCTRNKPVKFKGNYSQGQRRGPVRAHAIVISTVQGPGASE